MVVHVGGCPLEHGAIQVAAELEVRRVAGSEDGEAAHRLPFVAAGPVDAGPPGSASQRDLFRTVRRASRWLGSRARSSSCNATTTRKAPAPRPRFATYLTLFTAISATSASEAPDPPARCRTRAVGTYSIRNPAARTRAAWSTSSEYRKKHSSQGPTAASQAAEMSAAAPVAQSTERREA